MSTFTLNKIPIQLPPTLTKSQLLSFPAFQTWFSTLDDSLQTQTRNPDHPFHSAPYSLRGIEVQAVDFFGERIGFVKIKADVGNEKGEKLPGSVFLRGPSVGMLLILQPDDLPAETENEKQVILTLQPRIPAGTLSMAELPAGMLDDSGTFAGAAAKEIAEETGLEICASDLLNLTELALPSSSFSSPEEGLEQNNKLHQAVYPSPGGCDEYVPLFLYQKRIPRSQLKDWKGVLTGLRDEGEKITLALCPLETLWRTAGRDSKALAAWALYEGLRKEGKI